MKNVAKQYSDRCYGLRLKRIERYVSRLFDGELREIGLTLNQVSLLAAISQMAVASPARLSRFLDIEKSSLSRNLDLLERESWISSERGPSGRLSSVKITRSGEKKLEDAFPYWEKAQSSLEKFLSRSAIDSIETSINKRKAAELIS